MKNLKQLRKASGLDQRQIAESMNVSRATVSSWEVGRTEPAIKQLHTLCRVLGCTLDELLAGEVENS